MGVIEKMKMALDTMTIGEKFMGSIVVSLLGMGIVFLLLLILFTSVTLMEKILNKPQKKAAPQPVGAVVEEIEEEETEDEGQLVAVITAAIAASLHTSTHNIIVRNITRVSDPTPAWGKMGRMQQVNSRF